MITVNLTIVDLNEIVNIDVEDTSTTVNVIVEDANALDGAQGIQGIQGEQGIAGNISEITVSENILAFEPLNSDGTKADSSVVGKRGQLVGLALTNINSGFSGEVVLFGEIVNPLWNFIAGNILYLNGTSISTTPPNTGFIQIIGTMKNNTTLEININSPIKI